MNRIIDSQIDYIYIWKNYIIESKKNDRNGRAILEERQTDKVIWRDTYFWPQYIQWDLCVKNISCIIVEYMYTTGWSLKSCGIFSINCSLENLEY